MKKIVFLVLSFVILAIGAVFLIKLENEDDDRVRRLYAEAEPLEREREELRTELDTLESNYLLRMRDCGTIEILFTTMDEQVYTQAYPILRDHGLVGVLSFSPRTLINGSGNRYQMKAAEVNRLISEGWGTCLVYEKPSVPFVNWYEKTKKMMVDYNVPMPTSIYFINDDYSPSMESELRACGITTVILNGNLSETVSDPSAPLWSIRAMKWDYTGAATDIELLGRTDGANLTLTVEFDDPWDPARRRGSLRNEDNPEKESFRKMLSSWKDMIYTESALDEMERIDLSYLYLAGTDEEKAAAMREYYLSGLSPEQLVLLPKFLVTTVEQAQKYHLKKEADNAELQQQLNNRKAELESRLMEIDQEINAAYEAFNNSQVSFPFLK